MEIRVILEMKICFILLVCTSDFVDIRSFFEMKTRIRKNLRIFVGDFFFIFISDFVEFRDEHLCFLVHTLRI